MNGIPNLWNFIKEQADVLFNIKDWSLLEERSNQTKDISNISKTKSKVNYRELDMLSDFHFNLKRAMDIVKQSKNIPSYDKAQVEYKIDFLFLYYLN